MTEIGKMIGDEGIQEGIKEGIKSGNLRRCRNYKIRGRSFLYEKLKWR